MDLRTLSLASGIGGLDLGFSLGMQRLGFRARNVCYVEREAFAVAHLVATMRAGALDDAPVWTDVTTFDAAPWRGRVEAVIGGYPCQPFSVAGAQRGTEDPRHLWPHVARIVRDAQPALVFFENVANHLRLGGDVVFRELQGLGYRVAATLYTAEEVGAPHRRERLFLLGAHPERIALRDEPGRQGGPDRHRAPESRDHGADRGVVHPAHLIGFTRWARDVADADDPGRGERGRPGAAQAQHPTAERCGPAVANADGEGRPQPGRSEQGFWGRPGDPRWWQAEPDVGRVADGAPARVDRLRALGNAVVPEQAARALVDLMTDLDLNPWRSTP